VVFSASFSQVEKKNEPNLPMANDVRGAPGHRHRKFMGLAELYRIGLRKNWGFFSVEAFASLGMGSGGGSKKYLKIGGGAAAGREMQQDARQESARNLLGRLLI
jgi:hypothetical protein